jgi:ATP-dependent RNA helicase DeaD
MEVFRIEVGHAHGVKPGNIVGAIANEAGIDGKHIARIKIEEDYSTVELPAGMPKELIQDLRKVRVAGQPLNISKMEAGAGRYADDGAKKTDKTKKRVGSPSRRAKPKAEE